MTIVTSSQLTITDLNDGRTLNGYLNCNQPKVQIFNPNDQSYTPDWSVAATNALITPQLFIAGSNTDIISDPTVKIKWYESSAPTVELVTNSDYEIPTSGLKTLKIKNNILQNKNQISFICIILWFDPDLRADIETKVTIEFAKITTGINGEDGTDGTNGKDGAAGQNSIVAYVWTPEGNVVKNNQGSVKAQCDVYNGTTQVTTGVAYQWYKYKSGQVDQGAGVGWEKLTSTVNYGCTGYTSATLVIPATAVESMSSFICLAVYATKTYKDVATIIDQSDQIQTVIFCPEGTTFLNGIGEKNPTLKVYRAGEEIDLNGTMYEYKWSLRNGSGVVDPNFSMTGKTIKVTADKVDNIGNLICDLWTLN